ncbi:MAG: hypothetical protein IJ130_10795 [Solobacterium sp.]|nr:hypothetical protein [Solobacterium sp.]
MIRRIIMTALCALLVSAGTACSSKPDNMPYEPDTPEPDPHAGLFVSEYGTMEFSGDGESVTIDFSDELAELSGLPSGRHEAAYVFLSGDLPPHGSMPVRYDTAHELKITVDDVSSVIDMAIVAEDGKAYLGVGTVTPEKIPMLFRSEESYIPAVFEKQKGD